MAIAYLFHGGGIPSCSCDHRQHYIGIVGHGRRHQFLLELPSSRPSLPVSAVGFQHQRVEIEGGQGPRRTGIKQGGYDKEKATAAAAAAESGQGRNFFNVPVTCYQILGIPDTAEKDEIVKSVMKLKSAEVEEGYTMGAIVSRQELLMDVRDKLLFEPEYAGNVREKIAPRSCLCLPWAWLPGALCLLQEVAEGKLVLEIGRVALQQPQSKEHVHDLLLSMALAECSIAKAGFEMGKVPPGFEALARAQYLLRSRNSLEKLPLLSEIEESLEDFAPSCTLELLGMPHTPDNADRRRGAISALHELLRQGLDLEASCRVHDWPCFLLQAIKKLTAAEIVELLPWEALAMVRKNKKSLESQNQRVVIDLGCFYLVALAHLALGFSSRQTDLINKSKTICEGLEASEGVNLKFEESLCLFLLGTGSESSAAEPLELLELKENAPKSIGQVSMNKEDTSKKSFSSLEKWLNDSVLDLFEDTRTCLPSLASYFSGDRKASHSNKLKKKTDEANCSIGRSLSSIILSFSKIGTSEGLLQHNGSLRQIGSTISQLAPGSNIKSNMLLGGGVGPSMPVERNIDLSRKKIWEGWWSDVEAAAKLTMATSILFLAFTMFKVLYGQFGQNYNASRRHSIGSNSGYVASLGTMDHHPMQPIDGAGRISVLGNMHAFIASLTKQFVVHQNTGLEKNKRPANVFPSLGKTPLTGGSSVQKRKMPVEEAEALVKQWQVVKADALGPLYQVHCLPDILSESMLHQWEGLAELARSSSCFWRFVLLQLSVKQATIISDGIGWEMAEIDAVIEEAAELVDERQPKNATYYSTYEIRYVLRKIEGSWRFCEAAIQPPD